VSTEGKGTGGGTISRVQVYAANTLGWEETGIGLEYTKRSDYTCGIGKSSR